jgi:hypothetical protein
MFVWNKTFPFGSGFLESDEFGDWLSIPGHDEDLFGRKSGFRLRPPLPQIPNRNSLHERGMYNMFHAGQSTPLRNSRILDSKIASKEGSDLKDLLPTLF